jgi:hypothetical protein
VSEPLFGFPFCARKESKMDAFEEKIAAALRGLQNKLAPSGERTRCPNEETLALFLNGALTGDGQSEIEGHLATCTYCVEELVAGHKSAEGGLLARVPQRLLERAMALVSAKERLFDLAVRLVRGSIELINTTGRVVPLLRPTMRGQAKPVEDNALQVEQKLGRFKVAVEIDVSNKEACQLTANVSEENGAPADGVRLTLNADGREQASFLTRAGVVVFDRIAPGEYSIAVSESDNLVGKIRLNLMLER